MNEFKDDKLLLTALLNLTIKKTRETISSPLERAINYIGLMDGTNQSRRKELFKAIYERDNEAYSIIDDEYTKLDVVKQAEQILKQGSGKTKTETKTTNNNLIKKLKEKGY